MFDRLLKDGVYGRNKRNGKIRNMEVFLDIVKRHIQYLQCHNEFASDKCLNIKKLKEVSYVMKDYQETLNAYRGQKQKFQREFNEMRRRISQLKIMKELPEEKK